MASLSNPTMHLISETETQEEMNPDRSMNVTYLIASIVEPFMFVRSNHVTKFRLMSDSFIRITVA